MSQREQSDKKHSCSVCGATPAYTECDGAPYTSCLGKRVNDLERELATMSELYAREGHKNMVLMESIQSSIEQRAEDMIRDLGLPVYPKDYQTTPSATERMLVGRAQLADWRLRLSQGDATVRWEIENVLTLNPACNDIGEGSR